MKRLSPSQVRALKIMHTYGFARQSNNWYDEHPQVVPAVVMHSLYYRGLATSVSDHRPAIWVKAVLTDAGRKALSAHELPLAQRHRKRTRT